mgnify:CR=1 FL=1
MTFQYPYFGLCFLFFCFLCFTAYKLRQKKDKSLKKLWGENYVSQVPLRNKWGCFFRRICLFLGLLCLGFALMRPQWGIVLEKREQSGLNIIFAIDTSKSMLANDVRPNRLELAKMSIQELLKSIKGNQVGLIAFAGNAFLQCPSTSDYSAFMLALKALDTNIIPKGGTDLSSAMKLAETMFDEQSNFKQIILLTDGENLSGDALTTAQNIAKKGIIIHTVGIGSPAGSPISITNARGMNEYLKDSEGKTIITKLDESILQQIAQITHGFYVPLGNAGEGLQTIYQTALKNLPKENFESIEKLPIERYAWFASFTLLFLTLESLLYSFKKTKSHL